MKKLYLLLLICLAIKAQAQSTQHYPSTCTPSALLLSTYQYEIKGMAIRHLYEIGSPDTTYIDVPQRYMDTIAEKMAAICNLDTAVSADSVFRRYCIHNDEDIYRAKGGKIYVYVDISYQWTDQWLLHSKIVTGNTALDNFLARYGFKTVKPDYFSFVNISNDRQINFQAFADSLLKFGGVITAEVVPPPLIPEVYSYMECHTGPNGYQFGFSVSHEPDRKGWYYTVYDDCSVTLDSIDSYHDPMYSGALAMPNCNLFPVEIAALEAQKIGVNIYPNPANDVLHIATPGSYAYSIMDIYGRIVNKGTTGGNAAINISQLAAGIYIVQVIDLATSQVTNNKILKE